MTSQRGSRGTSLCSTTPSQMMRPLTGFLLQLSRVRKITKYFLINHANYKILGHFNSNKGFSEEVTETVLQLVSRFTASITKIKFIIFNSIFTILHFIPGECDPGHLAEHQAEAAAHTRQVPLRVQPPRLEQDLARHDRHPVQCHQLKATILLENVHFIKLLISPGRLPCNCGRTRWPGPLLTDS